MPIGSRHVTCLIGPACHEPRSSARAAGACRPRARCRRGSTSRNVEVVPPRDAAHGDLASQRRAGAGEGGADEAARHRRKARRQAARPIPTSTKVEVAGPGFLNMTLRAGLLAGRGGGDPEAGRGLWPRRYRPRRAHQRRVRLGQSDRADARRALPRRGVRRCAGQSAGFVGYEVTREYYINDAGAQVDALARSAFLRYREALGEEIGEIPAGLYPGDYLKPVGQALAEEHGHALLQVSRGALAAAGARGGRCRHAGDDQGGPRRPQYPPRGVLLRALADDGARTRCKAASRSCAQRG